MNGNQILLSCITLENERLWFRICTHYLSIDVTNPMNEWFVLKISVPPLSCAGFVCCHCTGRWAVLDNTHDKDSGAFC